MCNLFDTSKSAIGNLNNVDEVSVANLEYLSTTLKVGNLASDNGNLVKLEKNQRKPFACYCDSFAKKF